MELVERYWYMAVAIVIGAAWLWLFFVWRRHSNESKGIAGILLFGPSLPAFDAYLRRRGGLTRREWIGWAIVVLVGVAAVVFTELTGSGIQGR
jgi:hypothetical protein